MRITISKIVALLVGLLLEAYCIYYFGPLLVGVIVIVPLFVAMIWTPGFFSAPLPDRIGEKVTTVSAWGMLILLLAVAASRWLV